jgi:hypothetical protein
MCGSDVSAFRVVLSFASAMGPIAFHGLGRGGGGLQPPLASFFGFRSRSGCDFFDCFFFVFIRCSLVWVACISENALSALSMRFLCAVNTHVNHIFSR